MLIRSSIMAKLVVLLIAVILVVSLEAKKRHKNKQKKTVDRVCKKSDVEDLVTHENLNTIIERLDGIDEHLGNVDKSLDELRKSIRNEEKENYPQDCSDFPDKTGVKTIQTSDGRKFDAYCNGGWLYLMRRFDGSVDFFRTYVEYQSGFGDRHGEYFLGLDNLVSVLKQGEYTLHVDLQMWPPTYTQAYAQYSTFHVANASDGYRMHIGGYNGTAGDSLGDEVYHQDMKFSTKDNDQDVAGENCANTYQGAGWYGKCHRANLFGYYNQGPECPKFATCIAWYEWPEKIGEPNNYHYSFMRVAMKLYRKEK